MKTLKFNSDLVGKIISGKRRSTWRLFDDKNLQIGDVLVFVNQKNGQPFGKAKIIHLKIKKLADINNIDRKGKYFSKKEMYQDLRNHYGNTINESSVVKIINFDFKLSTIIEIPRGGDRRIHMRYDGNGFEDFGPIKERIPINDGIMPVSYGYLTDFVNKKEGDNVDCLVFTNKNLKTGETVDVEVIGIMKRGDGDHKILTKDETVEINKFTDLKEKERNLIKEYFGYKKRLKIEGKNKAAEYLSEELSFVTPA